MGLPGAKANRMSVEAFCAYIHDAAKEGGIKKAGQMIVAKGSFLPVARAAVRAIASLSSSKTNAQDKRNFCIKAFVKAVTLSDIHHFPYESTFVLPQGGRASGAPLWNSWCSFGGVDPTSDRTIRAATLLPSETVGLALRTALSGATETNILGDWLCAHVSLVDLPDVLKHGKLPMNFKRLGESDYVMKNMNWVIEKFDFANQLHTLALLYGFIVKFMNPAIFTHKDYVTELKTMTTTSKAATLGALRTLKWQTKGGKPTPKGNIQTDVFVVMFTAMVIGLYEELSPLRDYMKDHETALGLGMTSKYGSKGLSLILLARLGIIWAKGTRVKVYDKEWGLHDEAHIAKLHASFFEGFKDGVYGPCETLAGIVGTTKAAEMADLYGLPKRARMSHSQKRARTSDGDGQAGSSKRR